MLYDNALLARTPTWRRTRPRASRSTRGSPREILDYVLREMTVARGRLLLRDRRRQRGRGGQVLRLDAGGGRGGARRRGRGASSARTTTSTSRGNWEGHSILNTSRTGAAVAEVAWALDARRAGARVDALARAALRGAPAARAAGARRQGPDRLERPDDLRLRRGLPRARRSPLPRGRASAPPRFVLRDAAAPEDGRLLRTFRAGSAAPRRVPRGLRVPRRGARRPLRGGRRGALPPRGASAGRAIRARTSRDEAGGFYSTAPAAEALIVRPREGHDGATPSANAMAATPWRGCRSTSAATTCARRPSARRCAPSGRRSPASRARSPGA